MYLNQYSVRVVGGNEAAGGYVEMSHGQQYSLSLRNDRLVRCDARVEVDGKHVGTWRIAANSSVTLERPAHDTGHFTFYKAGTPEARQVALNEYAPELGLIRVVFTPEQAPRPLAADAGAYGVASAGVPTYGTYTRSLSAGITKSARSAGGTGLSGRSNQQFYQADEIEYDLTQQTVIHLRLVCKDGEPRPLTEYSTPIPPPIR